MNEFDRNDMKRMQKDAEERLRQMQQKANSHLGRNMPPAPDFVKINNRQNEARTPPPLKLEEPKKEPSVGFGNKLLNILDIGKLRIDNDISVILMIMLLLSTDNSDEILLLALVYIML